MKNIILLFISTLLFNFSFAENINSSINSSAKLNATCEFVSVPNLSFGELTVNPSNPSEFGLSSGRHTFPIILKCSPYTVVNVQLNVATPEQPDDDPYTVVFRSYGAYGVLTGQRTGIKLTYRFLMYDANNSNWSSSFTSNTSYTLSFNENTTLTQNIFTALRETVLPPPDFYSDTASVTLNF